MLTIRPACIGDLEALASLFDHYREFYKQTANIELAKNFVEARLNNKDSAIFVAENNEGKLIGFCQIYPSFCSVAAAKIGVLYDLFVDSRARKTGAGRALMLAAHEYAANNGMVRLDLSTAKNNLAAQALYESLGWKRDEIFYTYSKNLT
ncbi:MAG: GNAT family N-acetyltransferase [Methylotenera sp.]